MNDPKAVWEIIKKYRLKKGLTQKGLAALLFVEETTVSRWECGIGYPNMYLIDDICKVLDIEAEEILGTALPISKNDSLIEQTKRTSSIWMNLVLASLSLVLFALTFVISTIRNFFQVYPDTLMFIAILICLINCLAISAFSTLNLVIFLKKRKQLLWANIATITISLILNAILFELSLSHNLINDIYGVIAIVISIVITSFALINYLLSRDFEKLSSKIANYILVGQASLIAFIALYASITVSSYAHSSTILYSILLYFYMVICNASAIVSLMFVINWKKKSSGSYSFFGVFDS